MNKKLIAGPLVAVLFLLATATPALADGALFADAMYRDLYESAQRAVILYSNSAGNCTENCTVNGTEHLILSVSFEGDAEYFAWVIPVPSKPEITLADSRLFRELSEFTTKDLPTKPEHGSGCAAPPSEEGVDVIEQKVVGPYATAILSATNATALIDWLLTNGYFFPPWGEEIVSEYVEKEWYFVAMRINAVDEETGRALAEGAIEPIILSFASNKIVYPLRITSLSTGPYGADVLLYVLSDHIALPKQYPLYIGYGNWHPNSFTLEFGNNVSVTEDLSEYEVLPKLVSTYLPDDTFYLTKLRGRIDADQMVDIEMVRYLKADPLDSLAETHTKGDDIVVVTIIIGPVFGLYLWRRRRSTIISRASG